jgi:hypothetical protein
MHVRIELSDLGQLTRDQAALTQLNALLLGLTGDGDGVRFFACCDMRDAGQVSEKTNTVPYPPMPEADV